MNGHCGKCGAPHLEGLPNAETKDVYAWSTLEEVRVGCWQGLNAGNVRYVVGEYGEDCWFCWSCVAWRRAEELEGSGRRGSILCQHCDSSYRKSNNKILRVDGHGCERCWTRDEVLLL